MNWIVGKLCEVEILEMCRNVRPAARTYVTALPQKLSFVCRGQQLTRSNKFG